MKKLLFLAILLLPFTINAQIQSNRKSTNFIIKGGATISKIVGDDIKSDFTVGFQAGLLGRIRLKNSTIDVGVIYNQKGFSQNQGESAKLTMNYLTVPIHFIIPSNSKSSNFFIGPEINFLLNNRVTVGDVSVTFSEGVSPIDITFAGGIELTITSKIQLDIGASYGFVKSFEVENYPGTTTIGNNLSFSTGLKFIIN